MQIVYARAEQTKLIETGRFIRKDGVNYFPEMKATWEARAGMWKRKGTEVDIAKAKTALEPEGYTVLTFDCKDKDCLEKARQIVIKNAQ